MSARVYLSPHVVGDRLFFVSDLSGRLSLYVMDREGSVPEPLLPPDVALMTPELLGGEAFVAPPEQGIVVVMINQAGDENYQPCVVPIDGGDPEPMFGTRFAGQQVALVEIDQGGVGRVDLAHPEKVEPVEITGATHPGRGELTSARWVEDDRIVATYNVDGVSWGYDGRFDADRRRLDLGTVLWGGGALADGVASTRRSSAARDATPWPSRRPPRRCSSPWSNPTVRPGSSPGTW